MSSSSSTTELRGALATFNAELLVRNNEEDCDQGVSAILAALDLEDPRAVANKLSDTKIKREALIAGLAFLSRSSLSSMKDEMKGINKPQLVPRLISLYLHQSPKHCSDCSSIYQIDLNDPSITSCASCDVSLCPACWPATKIPKQDSAPSGTRLHVICGSCFSKMRSSHLFRHQEEVPDAGSDAATSSPTFNPLDSTSSSLVIGDVDPGTGTTNANNTPPCAENPQKEQICLHYQRNQCRYGYKGSECAYSHPKKCILWVKKGIRGCVKGTHCEYYHPKICHSSARDKTCYKESCKLSHLPGTARKPPQVTPAVIPAISQPIAANAPPAIAINSSQTVPPSDGSNAGGASSPTAPGFYSAHPPPPPSLSPMDKLMEATSSTQLMLQQLIQLMLQEKRQLIPSHQLRPQSPQISYSQQLS